MERWRETEQLPPQPGETILGCGHASHVPLSTTAPDPANPWQWFELSKPAVVASPVGNVESRWICTCKACLRAARGDVLRVELREHWTVAEDSIAQRREEAYAAKLAKLSDAELVELARTSKSRPKRGFTR